MGLFDRIATLFRSNINDLIERFGKGELKEDDQVAIFPPVAGG